MILNLQKEVATAKHSFQLAGGLFGFVVVAVDDVLRDLAREAAGKTNQSLTMLRKEALADARLLVEPVQCGFAGQADKIPIPGFIFRKDQQVVVLRVRIGTLAAMVFLFADVELAAKDRLQVLLLHGIEEVHRAEDVAVVGHRGRTLADLAQVRGQLVHVAGPIQ